MTKHVLTIFLMILSMAASSLAQSISPFKQPYIWIGMSLHLGMPRDAIVTKLSENYHFTKIQVGDDEWIVAEKNIAA